MRVVPGSLRAVSGWKMVCSDGTASFHAAGRAEHNEWAPQLAATTSAHWRTPSHSRRRSRCSTVQFPSLWRSPATSGSTSTVPTRCRRTRKAGRDARDRDLAHTGRFAGVAEGTISFVGAGASYATTAPRGTARRRHRGTSSPRWRTIRVVPARVAAWRPRAERDGQIERPGVLGGSRAR